MSRKKIGGVMAVMAFVMTGCETGAGGTRAGGCSTFGLTCGQNSCDAFTGNNAHRCTC